MCVVIYICLISTHTSWTLVTKVLLLCMVPNWKYIWFIIFVLEFLHNRIWMVLEYKYDSNYFFSWFSTFTLYMGIQVMWSFGVTCLDLYALRLNMDLRIHYFFTIILVGDWVRIIFSNLKAHLLVCINLCFLYFVAYFLP